MKANYNGTYFVAFYGIAYNHLYTADFLNFEKVIVPILPVKKNTAGTYDYIRTLRSQAFIDAMLNDMFLIEGGATEKLSIVLKENEAVICSDGEMMFAFSHSKEALDYATKQLCENLDSFRTPTFAGYEINE